MGAFGLTCGEAKDNVNTIFLTAAEKWWFMMASTAVQDDYHPAIVVPSTASIFQLYKKNFRSIEE
jgi:hypothetical protein